MISVEETGVPTLSYKFLWGNSNCFVLEDITKQPSTSDTVGTEQRDINAGNTQKKRGGCMLWVAGKSGEPDKACQDSFQKFCGTSGHHFNSAGCTRSPAE
ncbi:hypothetical protein V5799_016196 [Amblyomma americanum]|uniref:Lipocalin n=1 Tax=Amblyomma americanum TaxID=6943 RepID=A0AAQ4F6F3_AMBAM